MVSLSAKTGFCYRNGPAALLAALSGLFRAGGSCSAGFTALFAAWRGRGIIEALKGDSLGKGDWGERKHA